MSDEKEPLDIFDALGWGELKKSGSQMMCECPFCGKEKMYVDPVKTTFSCKVCGVEGNNVTVMDRMFTKIFRPGRDGVDFKNISLYRAPLPPKAFALDTNLGYDPIQDRYVWIVRKPNGMPLSLRTWKFPAKKEQDEKGKWKFKKTAVHNLRGCHLGLLGAEALGDKVRAAETVYICEGEWDRVAMMWMLDQLDLPGIVLGLPGASNFAPKWVEWFAGRDVVGLYDHDEPGKQGTLRCQGKIGGVVKSLKFLHWSGGKRDGYDIDDLVKENLDDLETAWKYLQDNLKSSATGAATAQGVLRTGNDRQKEQEDLKPITLPELYATYDKWLKVTNHDLLDVCMATCWTLYLPGNPLWMFAIAPPSGSKSEVIMPISAWHRVHALSSMTSKSLISGFVGPGNSDPSLLSALNGQRVVIAIKDLTPILQGRAEERDEIFGILRDAYDGNVTRTFGNGIRRSYDDLHFTVLAGVTPAIDIANQTALGERFLKFRADRDTDRVDDVDRAIRAIGNCGSEDAMRSELRDAAVRSLIRPFDPASVPRPGPESAREIAILAKLAASIRGVAPTERGTDLQTMAPLTEAPTRLATQFVKFGQGLALHYGLRSLDDLRVRRLIRRVALHTPSSVETKIAQVLYGWHRKGGIPLPEFMELANGLSRETVSRTLQRFARTGIARARKDGKAVFYTFTDQVYSWMRETWYFDGLPKTDVFHRSDFPIRTPTLTMKVRR